MRTEPAPVDEPVPGIHGLSHHQVDLLLQDTPKVLDGPDDLLLQSSARPLGASLLPRAPHVDVVHHDAGLLGHANPFWAHKLTALVAHEHFAPPVVLAPAFLEGSGGCSAALVRYPLYLLVPCSPADTVQEVNFMATDLHFELVHADHPVELEATMENGRSGRLRLRSSRAGRAHQVRSCPRHQARPSSRVPECSCQFLRSRVPEVPVHPLNESLFLAGRSELQAIHGFGVCRRLSLLLAGWVALHRKVARLIHAVGICHPTQSLLDQPLPEAPGRSHGRPDRSLGTDLSRGLAHTGSVQSVAESLKHRPDALLRGGDRQSATGAPPP